MAMTANAAPPAAGEPERQLEEHRRPLTGYCYSQDFSADRPSKRSMLRQARNMVSCTASLASKDEPSIR